MAIFNGMYMQKTHAKNSCKKLMQKTHAKNVSFIISFRIPNNIG